MFSELLWPDTHYLTGFRERFRGVKGVRELTPLSAFWFPRCQTVHTFGLRFPIDVVALDAHARVIAIKRMLEPNRVYWQSRAQTLIEVCALCPYPLESWIGLQFQLERRQNEKNRWAIRIIVDGVREHSTVPSVRSVPAR